MNKTEEFNFKTVREQIYNKFAMFSNGEDQIYSLDGIAEKEDIIYPKDLYKQDSNITDVVIFSFGKEKVRTISFNDDGSVTAVSRLISSIQSVELKHKDRGFSQLIISFSDNGKIEMDSQTDSDFKQWAYRELIMKLYKELNW